MTAIRTIKASQPRSKGNGSLSVMMDRHGSETIIASMTPETRAEVTARLMSEQEPEEIAKARTAGFREASNRAAKIIEADDFGGREAAAAKMLRSDKFDAFSSADIIGQLAEMPDTGAAEMRNALAADPTPQLGQDWPADQHGADQGWKRAAARVNSRRKAPRATGAAA